MVQQYGRLQAFVVPSDQVRDLSKVDGDPALMEKVARTGKWRQVFEECELTIKYNIL